MGIKAAFASCLLSLLLASPLHAQDNPDEVASQASPEDRADGAYPADPSEKDTSLVDPTFVAEPVDGETSDLAPPPRKTKLGARALQGDSDDMVDDSDNDKGDVAPKDRRAAKKKDAPKKDAPKTDGDKKGPAKDASQKKPAGCVDVSSEARFAGVGYDHIVTLKSGCKKAVKCVVRTNVTAEPSNVGLAVGAQESVVTWRGSPSRVFTPDVTCD